MSGHAAYQRKPQEYTPGPHLDCRIGKALEKTGTPLNQLFQNHLGKWVNLCPLLLGMKTPERRSITEAANLCLRCLSPAVDASKDHEKTCNGLSLRTLPI